MLLKDEPMSLLMELHHLILSINYEQVAPHGALETLRNRKPRRGDLFVENAEQGESELQRSDMWPS